MDFLKVLEKQSQENGQKAAIIFRDSPVSYLELKEFGLQAASGLKKLGVGKSDTVAIFLPNSPEYIYSFLGIFFLRGICVPLDFMLTEEEIVNFLNHSESRVLIAQPKKGVDFNSVRSKCPALRHIVFFGEGCEFTDKEYFLSWSELAAQKSDFSATPINENDPAAIFYTSGSTGHPKGVLLNYSQMSNPIETLEYFLKPLKEDSFLCAGVPFSHVGGLDYMLFMLAFGSTLVLMERFQPLEVLKNIEKYKITISCIVPAMYVALLSLKDYDKFDLSSLKYAVVFGAPSSPLLLERFHKVCPNAYLLNGWGLTETAAPNAFLPTGTKTKEIPYTGKFPPWLEAKIVDGQGNTLPNEKEGELLLRGKAIMAGYYKERELTAQVLTSDGWFKTGDVSRRDPAGRYYIVGRIKEMIKVGGEIVFCPEVEEVIHRHPKVKEVGVVGVPDKLRGEVPKAFIVLKEENDSLSEDDLRYFLRQHIAHFKIPHYFEFLKELPKNRVGKIDKEQLKKTASL